MRKKNFLKFAFLFFVLVFFLSFFCQAALEKDSVDVDFFYGKKCPHCAAEQEFLDKIEEKYSEVKVKRYLASDSQSKEFLEELCRKCDIEKYIGLVPLIFVESLVEGEKEFFLGFDSENNIGRKIENSIRKNLGYPLLPVGDNIITLPFLGEIDPGEYSLPALAILLGFLDGLNVCSLGALIFILGLVLALRSRKKIIVFGGIFILTTAIIYGFLIFLWYKLFSLLSSYIGFMQIVVGLMAIGGGIYFLRQFLKFRKQGAVCEMETGQKITSKFTSKIQESLTKKGNILAIAGSILLFAAVITIVEFPCSAAVPVVFAGILADAGLSTFQYLLYIALFILFYMLNEIIVFSIAVFKMSVWLTSKKFVTWITLIEAIILFLLGLYYLFGL